MSKRIQLQIHASKERATELTDVLLCYEPALVFSTSLMRDYHLDPKALSAKEQVLGYQDAQLYLISLDEAELEPLLDFLRKNLNKAGLHYQVVPIMQQGVI